MRNNRIVLALAFAAGTVSRTSAQTGPPGTFGYVPRQEVVASDPATQRVLMIYAQSEDYGFVTGELATTNLDADTKRSQVARWHVENSWNRLHLNLEPARMANGDWFHLKRPLLSYVGPATTRPIEARLPLRHRAHMRLRPSLPLE